jgi:hypothetical protein
MSQTVIFMIIRLVTLSHSVRLDEREFFKFEKDFSRKKSPGSEVNITSSTI